MNADTVCWGNPDLTTEIDIGTGGAESLFFHEGSSYCRVFMTRDQMLTLRDQLNTAFPATAPELAETPSNSESVQA